MKLILAVSNLPYYLIRFTPSAMQQVVESIVETLPAFVEAH